MRHKPRRCFRACTEQHVSPQSRAPAAQFCSGVCRAATTPARISQRSHDSVDNYTHTRVWFICRSLAMGSIFDGGKKGIKKWQRDFKRKWFFIWTFWQRFRDIERDCCDCRKQEWAVRLCLADCLYTRLKIDSDSQLPTIPLLSRWLPQRVRVCLLVCFLDCACAALDKGTGTSTGVAICCLRCCWFYPADLIGWEHSKGETILSDAW